MTKEDIMLTGKKTKLDAPSITAADIRLHWKRLCKNCLNSNYLKTKINCSVLGDIKNPDFYFCSWYEGKGIVTK